MSEYSDGSTYRQPLFTLTPEEVEIVKYHFIHKQKELVRMLRNMELDDEKFDMGYIKWKCQFKEISYILTRIKQWQDEKVKSNNSVDKG